MFDGDSELEAWRNKYGTNIQNKWQDYLCDFCGLGTQKSGGFDFA